MRNKHFLVLLLLSATTSFVAGAAPFQARSAAATSTRRLPWRRSAAEEKSDFDAAPGVLFMLNNEIRGGALVEKKSVIQLHGLTALLFSLTMMLESFGIAIPLIGPAAMMEGYDLAIPAMNAMTKLMAGLFLFTGLAELAFADDEKMKSIFVLYHVPLAVLAILGCKAAAKGTFGWFPAIKVTLFAVLGIIGDSE